MNECSRQKIFGSFAVREDSRQERGGKRRGATEVWVRAGTCRTCVRSVKRRKARLRVNGSFARIARDVAPPYCHMRNVLRQWFRSATRRLGAGRNRAVPPSHLLCAGFSQSL